LATIADPFLSEFGYAREAVRLLLADLTHVGPFNAARLSLDEGEGKARSLTVIHGAGGVGKSSLLQAIASTRPGQVSTLQPAASERGFSLGNDEREALPSATTYWLLGQDDAERQHPLCLSSPNTRVHASEELELLRRREQSVFDRVAREGGFAYLAIPSNRWFSTHPIAINAPLRTVARYDVRGSLSFDDRLDLARETKQALAYAEIGAALQRVSGAEHPDQRLFSAAMSHAVNTLLESAGFSYVGLDSLSFEPMFSGSRRKAVPFDALPTGVRHLVALGALPTRTLWGAYPGRDPRRAEGVVTIDEPELHQDNCVQAQLMSALEEALPSVQWLVATASPLVASSVDASAVIALRRSEAGKDVELFSGFEARTH